MERAREAASVTAVWQRVKRSFAAHPHRCAIHLSSLAVAATGAAPGGNIREREERERSVIFSVRCVDGRGQGIKRALSGP